MSIVALAALKREADAIFEQTDLLETTGGRPRGLFRCSIFGARAIAGWTGVGRERAWYGAMRALADAGAAAGEAVRLLGVGLAGGLRKELRSGVAVVVDRAIDAAARETVAADRSLVERVEESLARAGLEAVRGACLCVGRIAASPEAKMELAQAHPQALVVDMETIGWADAAEGGPTPWVAVRVVLDERDLALPNLDGLVNPETGELRAGRLILRRPGALLRLPGLARRYGPAQKTLRTATAAALAALASD